MDSKKDLNKQNNAFGKRLKQIMKAGSVTRTQLCKETGISRSRLKEIEDDGTASIAELRDIALFFDTSVNWLQEKNFFKVPGKEIFMEDWPYEEAQGFWGHIGILPTFGKKYLWYPISWYVRNRIYGLLDQPYMVIPCMNNKLLFLNRDGFNNVLLCDGDSDSPGFGNWDPSVSVGEVPMVVYEALDDHLNREEPEESFISKRLRNILEDMIKEKQWTESDILDMLHDVTVYFKTSKPVTVCADFYEYQTLTGAIRSVYDEEEFTEKIVHFRDVSGVEIILDLDNISMLEIPLLAVEETLYRELDGILYNVD